MYRGGTVETAVCPSRLLAETPWVEDFVEWWMWSVRWDGMSGQPLGAPRWPHPGGLRRQTQRLFEACKVLRAEWPHLALAQREAGKPAGKA